MASVILVMGSLSPVRCASSTSSVFASMTRASAGRISPASKTMMSPGTMNLEAMISVSPSRRTRNCGERIFFSSSTARSALPSCIIPIMVLMRITPMMAKPSMKSFMTKEKTDAAKRIRTIGSMM